MMIHCDLKQNRDKSWSCKHCNGPRLRGRYKRICKSNRPTAHHNTTGPGTELKALLRKFGLTSSAGCGCKDRARMMDDLGPNWCIENIETVTDWLEEAAAKKRLPFVRKLAKVLIRRAVGNARRRAKFLIES